MHPACSANLKVCFCEIPPGVTGQVNRIITSPASAESRFKSETEPSQGNNNFNTESTPQTVNYLSSFYSTCVLETYLAFCRMVCCFNCWTCIHCYCISYIWT